MIKMQVSVVASRWSVSCGDSSANRWTDGRPCVDRQWTECYAQLVGTVLSLWDAAALDAAGGEEIPATFVNLADASLKMVRILTPFGDCKGILS